MKHQAKQAFAWVIAFAGASCVYGGGAMWMKRLAANAGHESGHSEHEETVAEEHGEAHGHETAHEEHGKNEHAEAKHEEHGKNEHAEAKHEEHGKNEHHAEAKHGADKKEHHAEAKHEAHGKTEHHAEAKHEEKAAEHHAVAKHEEHGKSAEHHAEAKKESGHGDFEKAEKVEAKHDLALAGHDKKEEKHAAPHWSYDKKAPGGPANWGHVAANFSQCEKGREQSPIDLRGGITKANAPKIIWNYNQVAVNVENNGHTVVSSMPNDQNHITIDGEKYSLAQFHFHNPSEHKIGGIPSDMELHFVHKNDKGELAVIGVMINEKAGDGNPFFAPLWKSLPRESNTKSEAHPALNLAKLLPTHRDYFHYAGSLTTPPCSQGVRWFVLKEPVTMNGSQIELYSGIFGGPTNRPVQPLFGREVIQSFGPAAVAH